MIAVNNGRIRRGFGAAELTGGSEAQAMAVDRQHWKEIRGKGARGPETYIASIAFGKAILANSMAGRYSESHQEFVF
ncbi:hypothetical protein ACLOJK_039271 [Asimina triloba]